MARSVGPTLAFGPRAATAVAYLAGSGAPKTTALPLAMNAAASAMPTLPAPMMDIASLVFSVLEGMGSRQTVDYR